MIAVIDYEAGNLRSVEKALQFIGAEVSVTSDRQAIEKADAVILPGVGAYADCMNSLTKTGMDRVVRDTVQSGKPFLGICLGLQLLFEYSEEADAGTRDQREVGDTDGRLVAGLGLFKGSIRQLPKDMALKVPHMGWNAIDYNTKCPLFAGLAQKPHVYFVHSYYLDAADRDMVSARTHYGMDFDVAIWKDNVFATQFHPEKSGEVGIQILKNFLKVVKQ